MKRLLIYALIVIFGVLICGVKQVYAPYPETGWYLSEANLMIGEHTPIIYTGSDTLAKGGVLNSTCWMQIGYSPYATSLDNREIVKFNPEIFTFVTSTITPYPTHADNDSGGIGLVFFELAYDTTKDRFWNGDSSNFFIDDGTYNRNDDIWRASPFKRVATDTTDYLYPLKILLGGYVRFWFKGWNNTDNGSILDDSCIVEWKFTMEH